VIALDHIAIAGENLADARRFVEEALGVPLQPGGAHDVFHTHNALLGLEDGLYLEAITINPDAPVPERPRWFDLDRFAGVPRLTNWICRTDDLDATLEELQLELGAPVALQRGALRWKMAVPQTGILPFDNTAPALIQWQTEQHPVQMLKPSGVRLRQLTVSHPQAEDLVAALKGHFDDARVVIETGPAGLHARFDTPHGKRELSG
jgi:catechol 2,3-dioxygenase-like lactoylglutathione lyase family enzyme